MEPRKKKWYETIEDSKTFHIIVNIIFWLSILFSIISLAICCYKESVYVFAAWIIFIIVIYWPLFQKRNPLHAISDFINIIDDPIDDLKHRIHGMKIFGITIYLPKWLMRNAEEESDDSQK